MALMVKDGHIVAEKTSLGYGLELINPSISKLVAEFGVWKGDTLRFIRDTLDASWTVFGFDSFYGLPEDWLGTEIPKGSWNMDGKGIGVFGTTEYIGLFNKTIPEFLKDYSEPLALIHLDCNIYSSSRDVLFGLNDRLVSGTIIVYDDWQFRNSTAQQKAHFDWCWQFKRTVDLIDFNDTTTRG